MKLSNCIALIAIIVATISHPRSNSDFPDQTFFRKTEKQFEECVQQNLSINTHQSELANQWEKSRIEKVCNNSLLPTPLVTFGCFLVFPKITTAAITLATLQKLKQEYQKN